MHDPPLDPKVPEKILPIYADLSRDDLLKRCVGSYTKNSNQSLNALIWKFAPKHLHFGKETVENAAHITSMFNEGYTAVLWIMVELGLFIRQRT